MDFKIANKCKSCQTEIKNNWSYYFPNKDGYLDICESCGNYMKYLETDLVKDKVKFIRKIRCDKCNFRICKINNKPVCLWCINDDTILRHTVLYDEYHGKTHGFVLQNDFEYCIAQIKFRNKQNLGNSKLTHLTKKILHNESSLSDKDEKDEIINKRWM